MPTTPWQTLSHCFIKPPLRSKLGNRKRSNHGLADAADRALARTLRNFAPKLGLELGWGFTART
ncbi:hypothetical protein QC763_0050310 [Podospora pseudopauciseta]|uniref:Uncharacterized protein n=2 Tax=Podospora TaxID=5144 RepID=A0ABR0HFY7_9PEZI|nr:hypothetical protein QC763_0050310 [Podospora pseudopauciseta]KAK4677933.1 hypothetical protein QC764_0049980 [Podospora pseudoanserina]